MSNASPDLEHQAPQPSGQPFDHLIFVAFHSRVLALGRHTGRLVWDGPNVNAIAPSILGPGPVLQIDSPSSVQGNYEVAVSGLESSLSEAGISAAMVAVDDGTGSPREGCQPLQNAAAIRGQIALVMRGTCGFEVAGTRCREAAGACDLPESCTGASEVCPTDELRPSSATCREAVGTCDIGESCSGAAECPADVTRCAATEYCVGSTCVPKKGNGALCAGAVECR